MLDGRTGIWLPFEKKKLRKDSIIRYGVDGVYDRPRICTSMPYLRNGEWEVDTEYWLQ